MRADNWSDEDFDLLNLLFLSGLEAVIVGIEAGSNASLRLFNKRANIDMIFKFINLTKKLNIHLDYGFIMFQPYGTLDDLIDNSTFLNKAGLGHAMCTYASRLDAFPQTKLYNKLKGEGLLIESNDGQYSLFDYKYVDKRAERLMHKMQYTDKVMNTRPKSHFKNVIKMTTFTLRIRRKIIRNKELSSLNNYLFTIEKALDTMQKELNDYNHFWFMQCIEWVKQDGSDMEFDEILDKHCEKLEKSIKTARDVQMKNGFHLYRMFSN